MVNSKLSFKIYCRLKEDFVTLIQAQVLKVGNVQRVLYVRHCNLLRVLKVGHYDFLQALKTVTCKSFG